MSEKTHDENTNPIIPPWLGNTDMAAPCPCGLPMGEEFLIVRGETGLVRLFHMECVETEDDDE